MTITSDGDEGSLLPPSKRDLQTLDEVVRANTRNLKALSPGFGRGNLVYARMVTGTSQAEEGIDAVADDGDDTQYEWQWEDRYTVVTAVGDQTFPLTYVPVDESLFIRWHPDGGAGVPITNEHFTVTDNIVTLTDPGFLEVGDQFSAQYQFFPGEEDADDEAIPATLTLRDCSAYSSGPPSPGISSFALPVGTVIGDLIAVSAQGNPSAAMAFTDPRLTQIADGLWLGFASDLTDILVATSGSFWSIAVATYESNVVGWGTPVVVSTSPISGGGLIPVPSVSGVSAAICALFSYHGFGSGGEDLPIGYTEGCDAPAFPLHARVDHWTDPDIGSSPATTSVFITGTNQNANTIVVGLIGGA